MDKEEIILSVVMITYNHEKYLKQAIDSILMQDVQFRYEVIIGEDCSPDNSREILRSYEEKYPNIFKIIYREKNIGATKNLYDILTKCRGKYIAFLEGDDYWTDRNKLSLQVDFLEKNSDYIGTYHLVTVSDSNNIITDIIPQNEFFEKGDCMDFVSIEQFFKLYYKNLGQLFHIQSLVYRNIYINSKEDDKIIKILTKSKYICDTQIKLLVLNNGKIKFINKAMGNYRYIIKKDSESFSSKGIIVQYEDIKTVWNSVDEYFNYKYSIFINKIMTKIKFITILDTICNHNFKKSIQIFKNDLSFRERIKFIKFFIKKLFVKILNLKKKV